MTMLLLAYYERTTMASGIKEIVDEIIMSELHTFDKESTTNLANSSFNFLLGFNIKRVCKKKSLHTRYR